MPLMLLPLSVQWLIDSVPRLLIAPPLWLRSSEALVTVRPVMVALTPGSIRSTAPSPWPLIVRRLAPGPLIVIASEALVSSTGSRSCARVIVCAPSPG